MASKKADKKHAEALERFQTALEADRTNRENALEDAQFVAGEQWPTDIKLQRQNRPCLTINRLPTFIRQVSNEVRLKPPSINVLPSEEGDDDTAEVIEGLIRSIEARSKAKRVYSRGIEDSARCGMGFWRVLTEYANDEAFDLDLCIESIPNPLGVIVDPDAKDPLGSDWKYCFVIDTMTKDAFEAKYPGKSYGIDGDRTTTVQTAMYWTTGDKVQVAEYWCVEEVSAQIVLLENGETVDVKDYDRAVEAYNEHIAMLQAMYQAEVMEAQQEQQEPPEQGEAPEPPEMPEPPESPEPLPAPMLGKDGQPRVRDVKRKKVVSYIMSGGEFLSGPHEWMGKRIPIVPVWGEEYRIGDRKVRTSLIHFAKDAQRMINYWRSASVEALALAPKAPWLVTPKNVEGYEGLWKTAGQGNPAVLMYNPDPITGKPERQQPAPVQSAMLQEAALSQDDLKATTGLYDAALGAQSNETSGKAIMARQAEGDISTYAFLDNLLQAIEETGRILVEMIPKVYDVPRQIRILGKKMESKVIMVNDGGQYDLTRGKYDVNCVTGPSFTTQRQMAAEAYQSFVQSAPATAPILIPRMVESMDLPDAKEIAEELRGIGGEQKQAPPPPNPKDMAQAENYQAQASKTQVETQLLQRQLGVMNMGPMPGQPMPMQSDF
jgi:hypothetical protein